MLENSGLAFCFAVGVGLMSKVWLGLDACTMAQIIGGVMMLWALASRKFEVAKESAFYVALLKFWQWSEKILEGQIVNGRNIMLGVACLGCGGCWFFQRRWAHKMKRQAMLYDISIEELMRYKPLPECVRIAASPFPFLFGIFLLTTFIVEHCIVPTGSMEPTVLVGDTVLVKKFSYGLQDPWFNQPLTKARAPARGDIIVFRYPRNLKMRFVKRVIGCPGDTITYNHQQLTVTPSGAEAPLLLQYTNCTPEPLLGDRSSYIERLDQRSYSIQSDLTPDQHLRYAKQPGQPIGTWVVPEGHFFVLGDNRSNSDDSRYWGMVPQENIVGEAWRVLLSWNDKPKRFFGWIRVTRFFKRLK